MNKLKNIDVSHLDEKQKSIADIFIKVAKDFDIEVSEIECKPFYTPKEWTERGEDYGTESELVVVYDGLYSFSHICNTDYGFKAYEKLQEELSKAGYFFEQCTNWYGAVYKS